MRFLISNSVVLVGSSTNLAVLNVSELVDWATALPGMINTVSNCASGGASIKPAFLATRLLGASCPVRYNVEPKDEGAIGGRR